jgi:ABC-type branched-subunit amino acid transport system ATPase component
MVALLATRHLHCGYGADEIIHGVDLAVEPGAVVTILGPNGCGKTTLVKAILGYVKTTAGAIEFDGRDLRRLGPTERAALGIGYVPQLLNIFRPMTVVENLEIGGYRLDRTARELAMGRLFEMFPLLRERRRQKAGTLSGGERQLLAMARALMVAPTLLILDEPSAGLSPLRADDIFGQVRKIAEADTAIVIVEQDVNRALAISDWAYVLVTGRVAFHGPAAEIAVDERIRTAYLGGRRPAVARKSGLPGARPVP